jgi:hypothetical protein
MKVSSRAWYFIHVIPALGRQRQEDHKFEVSLDNKARLSQKKVVFRKMISSGVRTLLQGTNPGGPSQRLRTVREVRRSGTFSR